MTKESAADIIKYLDIVQNDGPEHTLKEGDEVHLGINTQGATVGQHYLFDYGIRWMKIVEDNDQHWLIEHGLLEHDADEKQYITKYELSSMIHTGEITLNEVVDEDVLTESLKADTEFNEFMSKVDRYLLINYLVESKEFNYAWRVAWAESKSPLEACEEAIILEG